MHSPRRISCLWLIALLLLPSCSTRREQRIVIGSKNFTESLILGELFAQQIETHTSLKVERRFYLAGTYICQQAILGGRIDLYAEYTGTALTAVLKELPGTDRSHVFDRVKSGYAQRFGLEVLPPLGFNDTFAMVVRGEDARRLRLKTISDVIPHAKRWRPGFGYEFMERPDGYAGLKAEYGLQFGATPRIMDLGLITRALKEKQVDIVAGNATDGLIPALDLFVLEDDRLYFPPYEAVPIVRSEVLREHPEVREALSALANQISDEDMRQLNYAVDGQHHDAKQTVHDFLARKKL